MTRKQQVELNTINFSSFSNRITKRECDKLAKKHRIEFKEKILELSRQKYNLTNIAEILGLNRLDVKIVLQENGLYENRKKLNKNNPELQKRAIHLYTQEKKTLAEIEKELDFPRKEVSKLLKENSIELRQIQYYNKKYSIKNNAFSTYSPESAYWAGFIAGDGCVYSHGLAKEDLTNNYLTVTLQMKDKTHVEKLKKFLEYDGVLYEKKNKKAISITVNSMKICEDLRMYYNISNNKTYDYIPPSSIPEYLIRYFILGLIDADGSVLRHKRTHKSANRLRGEYVYQIGFTGTYETCIFVKKFFNSSVKIHTRHKDRDNNNYTVLFQGNEQVLRLCSMLYDENSIKFCMQRKYENYLLLKEEYGRLI